METRDLTQCIKECASLDRKSVATGRRKPCDWLPGLLPAWVFLAPGFPRSLVSLHTLPYTHLYYLTCILITQGLGVPVLG